MTIQTISVAGLKQVKNNVIGNPSAKLQITKDEHFVAMLVDSLNRPQGSQQDIRVEAAHIISSLSYGSPQALSTLLRAGAHQAILYAICRFDSTDPLPLRAAFARALRAMTISMAEVVGPPQWGLTPDYSNTSVRNEAKRALDIIFQTDSLDIFLPLLSATASTSTSTSPPTSSLHTPSSIITSIAQLLASGLRTDSHRTAVAEWLPPSERPKDTRTSGSRRWEKTAITNASSSAKYGGWVAMTLAGLITSRDVKVQEAALSALAALAKDNHAVAAPLAKTPPDRDGASVLTTVLQLSKSKSTETKLAAGLCATHIYRASSLPPPSALSADLVDSCENTIMHILGRLLNIHADEYSTHHRTRACYILYYLVHDDLSLCLAAFERGCLESISTLLREITPLEAADEWGEDEAVSLSALREAGLTLIASLAILNPEIRRCVADELQLIPLFKSSLRHKHYGVRYAACQCIRALSRSVQALRTNLVDNGVGMAVLGIVMPGGREEDEDRRVLSAALAVVCNCVNDFSPLRATYLSHGLLPRLVHFIRTDDDLRKDALWAIKNLLTKTSVEEKREIMAALGWDKLIELFEHPDPRIQEQSFNIVRNLSENEEGIDLVFSEIGIDILLDRLRPALESGDDDVTQQGALALANLVNSSDPDYTSRIINFPRMLPILHACLSDRKTEIRRPVCSVICELARMGGSGGRKALLDEGFPSTLKRIIEWAGPPGTVHVGSPSSALHSTSPGHGTGTYAGLRPISSVPRHERSPTRNRERSRHRLPSPSGHPRGDEDKRMTELAKLALNWMEHGDIYHGSASSGHAT